MPSAKTIHIPVLKSSTFRRWLVYLLILVSFLNINICGGLKIEHFTLVAVFLFTIFTFVCRKLEQKHTIILGLIVFISFLSTFFGIIIYDKGNELFLLDQVGEGVANLSFTLMFFLLVYWLRFKSLDIYYIVIFYIILNLVYAVACIWLIPFPDREVSGAKMLTIIIPFALFIKQGRWLTVPLAMASFLIFMRCFNIYFSRGIFILLLLTICFCIIYSQSWLAKTKALVITAVLVIGLFYIDYLFYNSHLYKEGVARFGQVFAVDDYFNPQFEGYGSRLSMYNRAIQLLTENYIPYLLGIGLGMFDYLSMMPLGSHSSFFGMLAEIGIIGMFFYLTFFFFVIRDSFYIAKYGEKLGSSLSSFIRVVLSSTIIYTLTENVLIPQGDRNLFAANILIWLLIGWVVSTKRGLQKKKNLGRSGSHSQIGLAEL